MPEINLKQVLKSNQIGLRKFARQIKMPESTLSDFLNHGRLPAKWEKIKAVIEDELEKKGAPVAGLFESAVLSEVTTESAASGGLKKKSSADTTKEWEGEMLNQEALDWFGLVEDPFDKSAVKSEADVFQTASYKKTKKAMEIAITRRQFVAVWGQVGCGKTLLWTSLHESMSDKENVRIVKPLTLEKERLTIHNLEEAFIADLKAGRSDYSAPLRSSREARDRQVRDLLKLYDAEGIAVVLLIEEAHSIPMRTLKALKRLHEIQYGFSQPLSIILLGQPELMEIRNDLRVREVSRRCRFLELKSLRNPEFKPYIIWKFARVKSNASKIFTDNAWSGLSRKFASSASALQVSNLAAYCMNKAEEVKKKKINGAFIDALD